MRYLVVTLLALAAVAGAYTVAQEEPSAIITAPPPLPGCCIGENGGCMQRVPFLPGGCPEGWAPVLDSALCPPGCGAIPEPTPVPTPQPTPPGPTPTPQPTPAPTPAPVPVRQFTQHFAEATGSQVWVEVYCDACEVRWGEESISVAGQWSQRRDFRGRPPSLIVTGAARVSVVHTPGGLAGGMAVTTWQ